MTIPLTLGMPGILANSKKPTAVSLFGDLVELYEPNSASETNSASESNSAIKINRTVDAVRDCVRAGRRPTLELVSGGEEVFAQCLVTLASAEVGFALLVTETPEKAAKIIGAVVKGVIAALTGENISTPLGQVADDVPHEEFAKLNEEAVEYVRELFQKVYVTDPAAVNSYLE